MSHTDKAATHKILFATSEAHPLVKTGGLGDVSGSLPAALKNLRQDVRIIMPAYRDALRRALDAGELCLASLRLEGVPATVRLFEGKLPGTKVRLYLVDAPDLFDRPGNPYVDPDGHDWPDNAERFAVFAQAVTAVALNQAGLDWTPGVVHCNDWQTGLVPALLSRYPRRPATVFTIHNLAYHGFFPPEARISTGIPAELWHMHGLEFHGGLSYIKGGLVYADMINTVSPTYAQEIRTPAFGYGLEGLLNHRADRLIGILNGADYKEWNPAEDPHLPSHYDIHQLVTGKQACKAALQAHFNLPQDPGTPLLGLVGRLVEQKGIDLVLGALPNLLAQGVQLVLIGSGDKGYEQTLRDIARQQPTQVGVFIGYSEPLAHLLEAGADIFLMPSRFEPCGLNQLYSLRYGTLPVVRRTGGLADTVVDASEAAIADHSATGFVFDHPTVDSLTWATGRAIALYRQQPKVWHQLMVTAMRQDYSWRQSARHYLELYDTALRLRG